MQKKIITIGALTAALTLPSPLCAAVILDGEGLSPIWGIPFAGLLACLALMPLLLNHIWHNHFGKIAVGWSLATIIPLTLVVGAFATFQTVLATILHEYFPFIILVGSLYIVSGGILLDIKGKVSAKANTFILGLGTALAGWIGTTGAAMLMIRPLIKLNHQRQYKTHLIVFLIFLVANIGGSLTPLGDPPLFLGFLQGVSFFWTLEYLAPETFAIAVPLLLIFYIVDRKLLIKEALEHDASRLTFQIQGWLNFLGLLGIISLVLLSGVWDPGVTIYIFDVDVKLQNAVRDIGLISISAFSYLKTPHKIHKKNEFSFAPLSEVAKLFWGIFVTVIPVLAMLGAGEKGAFAFLIQFAHFDGAPHPEMYFWLTGWLSAFLDNAPTYLVFFHMAGGDPQWLMTTGHLVLEAISLGAVFMGAMTYIGNAPNFMVKAIAEENGIQMPSFFGFMKWSCGILLPFFILLTIFHF